MTTASGAPTTLCIADQEGSAREIGGVLREAGYEVDTCSSAKGLKRLLRERRPEVLLFDPESIGVAANDLLRELERPPLYVQLTSFGSVADAVEAMREGAFDYLCKPLDSEQVLLCVTRALESRSLRAENRELRQRVARAYQLGNVITRDPGMRAVLATLETVADTRASILLQGPTGTGKTMIARGIHQHSSRAGAPFVEVNCGGLADSLLESELFGHVRGAYTGATTDRPGRFEAAHGGTIFLDEIGTSSAELQKKLLRVLQDRVFERVGDTRTRAVDVRVIAATNADLHAEVRAGRFREDLLWRLCVVQASLPALRDRPGDIPLLAERFLERFAAEHERPARVLSQTAVASLVAHSWPGNVRELEHTIERAVLLSTGPLVEASDLVGLDGAASARVAGQKRGSEEGAWSPGVTLKSALEGPERAILVRALEAASGCRQVAASLLGLNRTTLFNKMKKYNLMEFPAASE